MISRFEDDEDQDLKFSWLEPYLPLIAVLLIYGIAFLLFWMSWAEAGK